MRRGKGERKRKKYPQAPPLVPGVSQLLQADPEGGEKQRPGDLQSMIAGHACRVEGWEWLISGIGRNEIAQWGRNQMQS